MSDQICGIYKITSPSNKIYIGQSRNIFKLRFAKYKNLKCKGQIRLYNSLIKHGWENHVFEVIEECEFDQLNVRERFWQDFYDVIGENGLNCMLTSTDVLPVICTEETRLKFSKSAIGRKMSAETRVMIGNAHKGKVMSEESRAKLSLSKTGQPGLCGEKNGMFGMYGELNPMFGHIHTDESKLKMSQKRIGNKMGVDNVNTKLILNTETGIYYYGTREAAFSMNIPRTRLVDYLLGRAKNKTHLIYC